MSNRKKKATVVKALLLVLVAISLLTLWMLLAIRQVSGYVPIPYGIWRSEEPNITLFVSPEYQVSLGIFPGKYVWNEMELEVVAVFLWREPEISIMPTSELVLTEHSVSFGDRYFHGEFHLNNGRLYYSLERSFREWTGYGTIVFELVEEVEGVQ